MIKGEPLDWSDERIEELATITDEDVSLAREWALERQRRNLLGAEPTEDEPFTPTE